MIVNNTSILKVQLDLSNRLEARKFFFLSDLFDKSGINVYEFRLFAHVYRRNECTSSIKTMADICKISERKIQQSIRSLKNKNVFHIEVRNDPLSKKKYTQQSNRITINDVNNWIYLDDKNKNSWTELRVLSPTIKNEQIMHNPPLLDLYGLNPYQFRILFHIAANISDNGSYTEGIKNISKVTKIGNRKIQYSLNELAKGSEDKPGFNILKIIHHKGKTSEYVIQDVSKWRLVYEEEENNLIKERTNYIQNRLTHMSGKSSMF
jgi:predicted transcriptional regulator